MRPDASAAPLARVPASLATWAASVEALSGWTVAALDVTDDAVRLTFRRPDRVLVVDRDSTGRCVVEMLAVDHVDATVGRKGDRARVDRVAHRLLWREKPQGIRSALRIAGDRIGSRELIRPAMRLLVRDVSRPVCVCGDDHDCRATGCDDDCEACNA